MGSVPRSLTDQDLLALAPHPGHEGVRCLRAGCSKLSALVRIQALTHGAWCEVECLFKVRAAPRRQCRRIDERNSRHRGAEQRDTRAGLHCVVHADVVARPRHFWFCDRFICTRGGAKWGAQDIPPRLGRGSRCPQLPSMPEVSRAEEAIVDDVPLLRTYGRIFQYVPLILLVISIGAPWLI